LETKEHDLPKAFEQDPWLWGRTSLGTRTPALLSSGILGTRFCSRAVNQEEMGGRVNVSKVTGTDSNGGRFGQELGATNNMNNHSVSHQKI
jgi:hypothetical protein